MSAVTTALLVLLSAQTVSPEAGLKAEVNRLVLQLDSNQRSEREAAEEALIKLGPEVLNLLPLITPRTPAEVKERLGRVRKTLETATAESIAQPSHVTLEGEMSLGSALQAMYEQTGNQVTGYQRRGGDVKVAFNKTPYWRALDEVLDQAKLNINEFGGEASAIVLTTRPDGESPRVNAGVYSGVFRLEALRVESRRDLRNPAVNGMRLSVSVAWEPRVMPIALRQQLSEITVLDDRGEELSITGSQGALNASAELGMSAVEFGIPLELASRESKRIGSLKGRFTALVPGRVESFEFANVATARDVEQERAGVVVTFERLRKNVDLYEARMALRFDDAANALESHRGWVYRNEAYLTDKNGRRLDNVGLQATRQGTSEVGIAYLFDLPDGPEGCTFVYKTPALILQLPVEYELKDIELP
ncbi:MAG: hypothetical protein H6822_12160 [Planctomycetaceae bacterium]|nr:hypothetical protein [Planctomycetales bacterium]MCB9922931.1 hypothetical protein [Planctomycetaceae bacterium]